MKKSISIFLAFVMMFTAALTSCAAEVVQEEKTIVLKIGSPEMMVNGASKMIDEQQTAPVIINDRTLLPVRAVVEEMGGSAEWDGEKREVTLKCAAEEIKLTIDSTIATLNGEEKTLDSAPTIINDRTMLPIRFIAESFKFSVAWDGDAQTVTITKAAAGNDENEPAKEPENAEQPGNDEQTAGGGKSLVVYFSATGNTKALAEKIAAAAECDIFEIEPQEPYTSDDLNYSNDNCRANDEQHDDSARPSIANKIENIGDYDILYIGYPIWWGTMPKIINTFLEEYDLSGKTIMPFCTSGGSGISTSVSAIRQSCPNADVKDGFKGSSSSSEKQISDWISSAK